MMNELDNWTSITKGMYRYVIASNVCYEIHVLYWLHDTDILTAKSNLYIVGDWTSKDGSNFTERELLLAERPLFECIEKAIKDNDENNN